MKQLRTLVVGHDADRTGAPIALERLAQWLVDERIIDPTFVFARRGDLVGAFAPLGDVMVWPTVWQGRARRALAPFHLDGGAELLVAVRNRRLLDLCRKLQPAVVITNTARCASSAAALRRLVPVVSYIHELPAAVERWCTRQDRRILGHSADHFLAASSAVARMLVEQFDVPEDRVTVVPGTVPDRPAPDPAAVAAVRKRMGAGPGDVVVGGSGPLGWTKGSDLFLQAALVARDRLGVGTPLRFCWLGWGSGEESEAVFRRRSEDLGLADHTTLLAPVDDPFPVLAAFDVFVSSSRQDANPLTVMEAMSLGRPVVCFAGAGGAEQLAAAGGGLVARPADVDELAGSIARLAADRALRRGIGERGRQLVAERHHPKVAGGLAAEVVGALAR